MMSVKVSLREVQNGFADMLDHVVTTGEEYVVQRDGKDCAVIVSARQWRRRCVGQRLDALGADHRLASAKQAQANQLLAARQQRPLTAGEQRELKALLRECDAIMRRRAEALDQLL